MLTHRRSDFAKQIWVRSEAANQEQILKLCVRVGVRGGGGNSLTTFESEVRGSPSLIDRNRLAQDSSNVLATVPLKGSRSIQQSTMHLQVHTYRQ